jgi:hypothetical protein
VKRALLLLALLPSLASATDYYATNSGTWATTTIWSPNGTPGTSDAAYNTNGAVSVTLPTAATPVGNVIWLAGTLTSSASAPGSQIAGNFTASNCWVTSAAGLNLVRPLRLRGTNTIDASAVVSNCVVMFDMAQELAPNLAGLAACNSFSVGAYPVTLSGVTNSWPLRRFNQTSSTFGLTGEWKFVSCVVTTGGFATLVVPITLIDSSVVTVDNNASGQIQLTGGTVTLTNSTFSTSADIRTGPMSNAVCQGTGTFSVNCGTVRAVNLQNATIGSGITFIVSNLTWNASSATGAARNTGTVTATADCGLSLTLGAPYLTAGYAHTAGYITNNSALTASNSTITVSNFVNSATFTHSGVTRMLAGGVFNSTNGATLSVVSGHVTLATNTVLSGTIYSEAPSASASLNLNNGTLTVSGQSLFSGTISNGVIGASAPVTAERTQGVNGRINSIEQMGAE